MAIACRWLARGEAFHPRRIHALIAEMVLVVFGVIGELSAVSLVIPKALFLIPLTRFPGFVWMIVAGFTLPASPSDHENE